MLLEQPEQLASDLEKGLAEVHWLFKGIYPTLRLRSEGVCGISTIAVTEHLREQGYEVQMVISQPALDVDPGMRHVMPLVYSDGSDTLIDTSYSQFLSYAGQTPGYVMFGGRNMFPENKIEIITNGRSEAIVDKMTETAMRALDRYEHIDDLGPRVPEFVVYDKQDIAATYAAIWDPSNFDLYEPTEQTLEAGKKLASFVASEHIRLIA